MMRWSFVLVCAVVLVLIQPARALACSCYWYSNHFYADDGGSIPINGRGCCG